MNKALANAISGILQISNPEVRERLSDIKFNYLKVRGIFPGSPLSEEDKRAICELWADYIIDYGSKNPVK